MDVVRLKRNSVGMSLVQSDIDEVLKKFVYFMKMMIDWYSVSNGNSKLKISLMDMISRMKKLKRTQITVDGNKIDVSQYQN